MIRFPTTSRWQMSLILAVHVAFLAEFANAQQQPPTIPVGLDAYRMWDRWPYQRIGARAYMRSTYDRRGGNESADASHFLYQTAEDFNVVLDVEGKGVLYFVRTNKPQVDDCWHDPWNCYGWGNDSNPATHRSIR